MKRGECADCGQKLWVPSDPVEFTAYCPDCSEDDGLRPTDSEVEFVGGGA